MTSHELARLLLARRDNDLTIEFPVSDDIDAEDDIHRVELDGAIELRYDSDLDCLVLRTKTVFLGDPEADVPDGLCSIRDNHLPHLVIDGALAPFCCHADQSRREPFASEQKRS